MTAAKVAALASIPHTRLRDTKKKHCLFLSGNGKQHLCYTDTVRARLVQSDVTLSIRQVWGGRFFFAGGAGGRGEIDVGLGNEYVVIV